MTSVTPAAGLSCAHASVATDKKMTPIHAFIEGVLKCPLALAVGSMADDRPRPTGYSRGLFLRPQYAKCSTAQRLHRVWHGYAHLTPKGIDDERRHSPQLPRSLVFGPVQRLQVCHPFVREHQGNRDLRGQGISAVQARYILRVAPFLHRHAKVGGQHGRPRGALSQPFRQDGSEVSRLLPVRRCGRIPGPVRPRVRIQSCHPGIGAHPPPADRPLPPPPPPPPPTRPPPRPPGRGRAPAACGRRILAPLAAASAQVPAPMPRWTARRAAWPMTAQRGISSPPPGQTPGAQSCGRNPMTNDGGTRPSTSRGSVSVLSSARSTASSQALLVLGCSSRLPTMVPSGDRRTSTSARGLPAMASGYTMFGLTLALTLPL